MRMLIAAALLALLGGCATVDGLGQDISNLARSMERWL